MLKIAVPVLSAMVLANVACERPRMATQGRGEPARPAAPATSTSTAALPAAEPAPVPVTEAPATPAPAPTPVEPTTAAVRVYNPEIAESVPTCQGEECLQPILDDSGRYRAEQPLRFEPRSRELDIVFVLDTSASMHDEHQAIAREIIKFVAELSEDVSYRIGILLAHGPKTRAAGVQVGRLFARAGEAEVIKADEIRRELDRDADLEREANRQGLNRRAFQKLKHVKTADKVAELLLRRLTNLPIDRSEAQGEAGMLNLYQAFHDGDNRAALTRAGLLRSEAALLIVTVADEQDICFDYEAASRERGELVVGTYAAESDRRAEQKAFQDPATCAAVVNGQRLTAAAVVSAVKQAKRNMPVIFAGIHYLEGQVPERQDVFAKDNEAGRGYLDLIRLADGRAIDLATEDFGKILAKVGDFSNFRMKYEDSFPIPGVRDVRRVDPNSILARIEASNGEVKEIPREQVRYRLSDSNQPEIVVDYEFLDQVYKAGLITPGAKLVILYSLSGDGTEATE